MKGKILLFFLICILGNSCSKDFLDKIPQGVVSDISLANTEGIESLLIAAYAELDGFVLEEYGLAWPSSGSNWIYGDIYADDAYKGAQEDDQPEITMLERYMLGSNNFLYSFKWKLVYDGVSRCNDVLRVVNLALDHQSIKQSEAIEYRAEARFLRAYYHLEAIKMWDFVPFVDENNTTGLVENIPSSTVENNAGETPWDQLGGDGLIPWEKVEEDVQFAIDNLPDKPRNGQVGRTHKYAALAIMAKMKLFQEDYTSALNILNSIIEGGGYSLAQNYHANFRIDGNNNLESIFQIQASVNEGGTWMGVNGNFGDILNFPQGSGAPGRGCCSFYQPSQNLVNAFKTTDGIIGGLIPGIPYLNAFNLDFNKEGDDVKNDDGIDWAEPFTPDTRPLDPRLDWTVGRRSIPYLDWGPHPGSAWIRVQAYGGPYTPIKNVYYQAEEGTESHASGWGGQSANNYSIIRYADILLWAAECEVEVGDLSLARDHVNKVRARASDGRWVLENGAEDDGSHNGPNGEQPAANYVIALYPDSGPSDPFQTQTGAREAVRFERRLEFGMEGHRFWDLKRWGVAKSTLEAYLEIEKTKRSHLIGAQFNDKNIRHPIPQVEIDNSKGILKQNPGY
jgi:hypothetical protein